MVYRYHHFGVTFILHFCGRRGSFARKECKWNKRIQTARRPRQSSIGQRACCNSCLLCGLAFYLKMEAAGSLQQLLHIYQVASHHIPICAHFHRLEYMLLINRQLPVMCVVQYRCATVQYQCATVQYWCATVQYQCATLQYWCATIQYWCAIVLMCYSTDVLQYWCVAVLMCYCTDVLQYWCTTVLMCYSTDVLLYS